METGRTSDGPPGSPGFWLLESDIELGLVPCFQVGFWGWARGQNYRPRTAKSCSRFSPQKPCKSTVCTYDLMNDFQRVNAAFLRRFCNPSVRRDYPPLEGVKPCFAAPDSRARVLGRSHAARLRDFRLRHRAGGGRSDRPRAGLYRIGGWPAATRGPT